jgi:hypothetical protein
MRGLRPRPRALRQAVDQKDVIGGLDGRAAGLGTDGIAPA